MKKNIFFGISFTIISALCLLLKNSSIYAAVKEGAKFEDWAVVCEHNPNDKEKTKKICYLSQSMFSKEKDKEQKIAEFKIGYFNNDKQLKMVQVLPFGINISAGTAFIIDKEIVAPGKFVSCYNFGCMAAADLKEDAIKKINDKSEAFVGFFSVENSQQINLKLSLKGLKKGLEALK